MRIATDLESETRQRWKGDGREIAYYIAARDQEGEHVANLRHKAAQQIDV